MWASCLILGQALACASIVFESERLCYPVDVLGSTFADARLGIEKETAAIGGADLLCAEISPSRVQVEVICDRSDDLVRRMGEGRHKLIEEYQDTGKHENCRKKRVRPRGISEAWFGSGAHVVMSKGGVLVSQFLALL